MKQYKGTWQLEAGIRNDNFPVTYHQARPTNLKDQEIYRRVVDLWNRTHQRLKYNSCPNRLKIPPAP
jgi:DNA (cytosine-5)-methyltransferase 1